MAFAFIVAIFLGDIWIGITIPMAMFIAPLLFITTPIRAANLAPALWVLFGLAVELGVQWLWGMPANGKSDLVVYLPLVYAGFTILALRNVNIADNILGRAIVAGGALAGAFMLIFAALVPSDTALLPGQNFFLTDQQYAASGPVQDERTTSTLAAPEVPRMAAPEMASADELVFYDVKNRFKSPLGLSNYLAVFFVFAFTVAAFMDQKLLAALFAVLTIVTLSRFGICFLVLSAACLALYRTRTPVLWLAILPIGISAALVSTLWMAQDLPLLPTSLRARVDLWRTGVDAVALNPLLGSSRSHVIETLKMSLTWNPHNLVLLNGAYFGVVGVGLYGAYVVIIIKAFYDLAKSSAVWAGVLVGTVVLLGWAAFEPIAMTPAFEILMAALYVTAASKLKGLTDRA